MAISVGIDIGGTFTDVVAMETTRGEFSLVKVPSTPGNFDRGFFDGLGKIMSMTGTSGSDVVRLVHGTTVATNAAAERKGAKVGLLTTEGFEDVLLIGRGGRSEMYDLFHEVETPVFLVDHKCSVGIRERLDSKGNVLTPLNEEDVIKAIDYLVQKQGVETIAVCYLFSFVNPSHEQRTEWIIHEHYPNVRVSLSSIINPRFREYERTVITSLDAYVGFAIKGYIGKLEEELCNRHIGVGLQVMQSRGGITSAVMCVEKPVVTLLSGPAAGVAGGVFIGKLAGYEDVITLDMGGTSNDVALIRGGKPHLSIEGKFGKYPLRQAMVDVSTIGAGGGSIAWVVAGRALKVGPQSAGAKPGPACYGQGGKEPTFTDASVVLGYLNPEYFNKGELVLKPELAQRAIQERVAKRLGMDVVKAAAGIHTVLNNNIADQLRLVSVYRGYHPKDFSLVAFGGAGPMVAGKLMQLLKLKAIIIPPSPGVLSALGLLVANIEHEEVRSFVEKATEVAPEDITRGFSELAETCEKKRERVGISATGLHVHRSAEMRYVGQSYEIEVSFPEGKGEISREIIKDVVKRFHETHQSIYQHSAPDTPTEFMNLRMVYSQTPWPTFKLGKAILGTEAVPKMWRRCYFDEYEGLTETPVYERGALVLGQKLRGPAIVEQADTTTVVYPNQVAEVGDWGNLILRVA